MDLSLVRFSGGYVSTFFGFGESRVIVTSGDVGDARAFDDSTFLIHGGFFDAGVVAAGNSHALIDGGSFPTGPIARGSATVELRGGQLVDNLIAEKSGRIDVYGTGLAFFFDEDDGHLLGGRFADGTLFSVPYAIRDQGQIILHEVPEPAACSLALAAVAAALVARAAQQRRRRVE